MPGGSTCSMGVRRGVRGSVTSAVPPGPASTTSRTAVAAARDGHADVEGHGVRRRDLVLRVDACELSCTSSPARRVPTVVTTTSVAPQREPVGGDLPVDDDAGQGRAADVDGHACGRRSATGPGETVPRLLCRHAGGRARKQPGRGIGLHREGALQPAGVAAERGDGVGGEGVAVAVLDRAAGEAEQLQRQRRTTSTTGRAAAPGGAPPAAAHRPPRPPPATVATGMPATWAGMVENGGVNHPPRTASCSVPPAPAPRRRRPPAQRPRSRAPRRWPPPRRGRRRRRPRGRRSAASTSSGVNVMTPVDSSNVTTIRRFGPRPRHGGRRAPPPAAASSVTSTAARRPIEPWKLSDSSSE